MLWHIHNWSDLCDWKDSSRTLGPIKLLMTRTKRSLCRCGCSGCLFLVPSCFLHESRGRSRCVFSAQPSSRVTGSVSAPIRATHVPQPRIVIAELSLPSSPGLRIGFWQLSCICSCFFMYMLYLYLLSYCRWVMCNPLAVSSVYRVFGTVRFRAFYLKPN